MKAGRIRDALAGAVAAGLGLGVSELVAGLVPSAPSLVEGLGDRVIDNVPAALKDWAISVFGTGDKVALLVGIAAVTVIVGAVVGVAARRRFIVAVVAFVGFGILASWASTSATVSFTDTLIPATAAVITGLATLRMLHDVAAPPTGTAAVDGTRRRFILATSAVVGVAALSAGFGRVLIERAKRVVAGREDVVLPTAAQPLPAVADESDLAVDRLTPIIVPNEDFYRIDAALSVPRVDLEEWTLSVTGMVDRPYSIDFAELLDMRMIERDVTLSCVSNPVGGDLVGNARWLGVPLVEVLDRARVQSEAEQIVGRSVDGFTVGFPVEAAYDGREALVAVGMNGEPLPFEHGFPVRLVVAGLYGYVSATKWLSEIELTTWDGFDAYWVPRGWAKEAPVKTQSRIDTPTDGSRVTAGTVPVAGVAWAPNRGITKVEVQLGVDGEWVEAELSEPLSENAWVQWRVDWEAAPGRHIISCRATDGTGELQTEQIVPPAPDGATGWHRRAIQVDA